MPELASLWSLQTRVRMISAVAMCTGLVFGGIGMYRAAAVEDHQITEQRLERLALKILASVQEDPARNAAVDRSPDLLPKVERQESGLHKYQVGPAKFTFQALASAGCGVSPEFRVAT